MRKADALLVYGALAIAAVIFSAIGYVLWQQDRMSQRMWIAALCSNGVTDVISFQTQELSALEIHMMATHLEHEKLCTRQRTLSDPDLSIFHLNKRRRD